MKKITVNELGKIITGHTPPTTKREFYGDAYPFLKPTDMVVGSKFTYEVEEGYSELAAQKYSSSLIPKNSTCVVCIGTLGEKMCMAHCDLFTNQSVNSIIPSEEYDPGYVYYLLKYNLHRVKALNKGTASGREFVSKSTFLDLELDVYEDISMQKKVSDILSLFDDLIENNQKQIKLLEEAAQRLYKEWFVDLHFPGYEDVKIVDGVPEGWRKDILSNVAVLKAGGDKPNSFSKVRDEKNMIPVFSNGTENEGLYGYTNEATITENSVTISARGSVGYTCLRRMPYVPIVRLISVIPYEIDVLYLYLFLRNNKFDSNGAAQQQITVPMIREKIVLVPSDEIIYEFKKIVNPIFDEIECLKSKVSKLSESRERLLPKLMSGELEV